MSVHCGLGKAMNLDCKMWTGSNPRKPMDFLVTHLQKSPGSTCSKSHLAKPKLLDVTYDHAPGMH